MRSPTDELRTMRLEEERKRVYDQSLSLLASSCERGPFSAGGPSRPFTRQFLDDSNSSEYATSFEEEFDGMLFDEGEADRAIEDEKSKYMAMFNTSVRDLSKHKDVLQSKRSLFCGQRNFFATSSSQISLALMDALTADPSKVDPLHPSLSSPTRVYKPYVSRFHRSPVLQRLHTDVNILPKDHAVPIQRYLEELDGHPLYGWEQVLMLTIIFELLDTDRHGSISMTQLLKISTHSEARSIIRYTLFGTYLKLRQEALFSFMFKDQRNGMDSRIDMKTFVGGLKAVSIEKNVPARLIRLNEEHKAICLHPERHKRRNLFNSLHRKAFLRRTLKVGDFVWALFFEGVVWFPAVIESIGDDGTYTVRYLLSATKIKAEQDKPDPLSRLRYPVSDVGFLPVLPLDEDGVLEYVFDDIDVEKNGVLNCQYILDQLKGERYQNVVKASLALGTLILDDHAPLNVKPENQKSFHLIALQLFYDKANLSNNYLSRLDFVEIGKFIVDIVSFNVR